MAVLDLEKIKKDGLAIDVEKCARMDPADIPAEDKYRLKMHGICVQRHGGFSMMRHRIPGGRLNVEQMACLAETAGRFASGFVHLTTRQNVELHSVKLSDVPGIFRRYAEVGITTRSACGHTFRNVIGNSCAGVCPGEWVDTRPWVALVSRIVVQKADRYNHLLPKRLNVSFSGCGTCESTAAVNDIGFTAVRNDAGETGFSLHVAGSLGVAPRMGQKLVDFLPLPDVIPALLAVTELHIRHTDRSPAKGRLKFLLESWGLAKFREEFDRLLPEMRQPDPEIPDGFLPEPWEEVPSGDGVVRPDPPAGVAPQRQSGFYRVPLFVPMGEIHHTHFLKLARWVGDHSPARVLITKEQNLEVHFVRGDALGELTSLAESIGCPPEGVKSILDIQACPGVSFCSLAITSSQGAGQGLMEYFRAHNSLSDPAVRSLRVHVSGCPNSCSLHQGADIGFSGGMVKVGEDPRYAYQLYLGGKVEGEAVLGALAKRAIADDMVVPVVDSLLQVFRRDRGEGEPFGGFLARLTVPEVVKRLDQDLVERGMSPNTYNRVAAQPTLAAIPGG